MNISISARIQSIIGVYVPMHSDRVAMAKRISDVADDFVRGDKNVTVSDIKDTVRDEVNYYVGHWNSSNSENDRNECYDKIIHFLENEIMW